MQTRLLGQNQLAVSALGLGCMSMSKVYGETNDESAIATIQRALDLGINLLDTADLYGDGHNEQLIGKAIKQRREEAVIATKTGFVPTGNYQYKIDGSPKHIYEACDASLKRLGVEYIDLYYLHRADPNIAIEESVDAMANLVKAGKVKHIGLSQVKPDTLRRAHQVYPITALQAEYSLWHRAPEQTVLPVCRELNIGFVPYSPLGRGFLTGTVTDINQLSANDFRRSLPKFQGQNFQENLKLQQRLKQIADKKGITTAQLALAWLLAQAPNIVPIPGTKHEKYLLENIAALEVHFTALELNEINQLLPLETAGAQYPDELNFEV